MSSKPKYWPCSMLIITTSPSISAVRTEGLRETMVESAMRLVASALSEVSPVGIAFCASIAGSTVYFYPPTKSRTPKSSGRTPQTLRGLDRRTCRQGLRLFIATFDPAYEPADMQGARQRQPVFG